jgi:hypothetical protein
MKEIGIFMRVGHGWNTTDQPWLNLALAMNMAMYHLEGGRSYNTELNRRVLIEIYG